MRTKSTARFLFAFALGAFGAQAQACKPGELRVFVLDSQQAPIFEAKVRVGQSASSLPENLTPALGTVDFENVPCGEWNVTAAKEGFEAASKTIRIWLPGRFSCSTA